jgi:hypothetical protein
VEWLSSEDWLLEEALLDYPQQYTHLQTQNNLYEQERERDSIPKTNMLPAVSLNPKPIV